jgi:hypothetical protein
MLTEQITVTIQVADALEALGVVYTIVGSFASALHGVMRATMDVDLVADLRLEQADPFARTLGDDFSADPEMMRDAIRRHSSFNLIHLDSAFKADVFVARPRDFDRAQLARRQSHLLSEDPKLRAYVASAEDTVLSKLESYRMGGELSERQWRDVLGVLKVQKDRLDQGYTPASTWPTCCAVRLMRPADHRRTASTTSRLTFPELYHRQARQSKLLTQPWERSGNIALYPGTVRRGRAFPSSPSPVPRAESIHHLHQAFAGLAQASGH